MIELTLLGLSSIRGPDGAELAGVAAQPKRFALLAYLVVTAGDGHHRRDSIAAMFWPELDQPSARRALRNTVYHLREALGATLFLTQGDDALSVNTAEISCDLIRLRGAAAAGRHEEAVDCYRGELLAGIHFAQAGEIFEEWLSAERRRVVALVIGAIGELVGAEERAGQYAMAARWALKGCGLAPDDEGWLRRAMQLLELANDNGGALRAYEYYAGRLASEFSAQPSAETESLAARIRLGGNGSRRPATIPPATTFAPAPSRSVPARSPQWRLAALFGAAALVGVAGFFGVRSIEAGRPGHTSARPRVLVAVFENRTDDPALEPVGRMAQDWLSQGLVRRRLAEVVDPHTVYVQGQVAGRSLDPVGLAHRTGATLVVSGSYYRSADTLFAQAALTDVATERIVRVVGPVRSTIAAPVPMLEELRSRVMTALAFTINRYATQNIEEAGDIPTFDAYRDYVDGYDAFWHGDGPRAESLFIRSARLDSGFTAAVLGAAVVAANGRNCPLVDSLREVLRNRSLDRISRLTVEIAEARCGGRNDEMLRLTLERADADPDNSSSQMAAAAAALWANRPGRSLALLARIDPAVDLAWSSDATHFNWFNAEIEALHLLGRYQDELLTCDRLPHELPLTRIWLRGAALAALARPTAALALLDSGVALPVETASDIGLAPYTDGRAPYTVTPGWVANWISRELAVHGDTVAARQAATRGLAWYRSRPADERETFEERLVAAWSLEMSANYADAERMVRRLVAEQPDNVDFRGELGTVAAEQGEQGLADSTDRWLAAQPVSRVSWTAASYRAQLAALRGQPDSAMARLREAFDAGLWPRWLHQLPALAPLRGRADFQALTRPKD